MLADNVIMLVPDVELGENEAVTPGLVLARRVTIPENPLNPVTEMVEVADPPRGMVSGAGDTLRVKYGAGPFVFKLIEVLAVCGP